MVKFPGYKFDLGKSTYRGEEIGEGGYVYAEPGYHTNVALIDVASMHPTSIRQLNMFGDKYTKNFGDIVDARLAIKHRDFDKAGKMLDGKLKPYLNEDDADNLAYALKIVINIVYGMTSAKFDNPFRDLRNKDNIVAKRGALFMVDLKHEVQARGFTVAHIKTDSIKIPNATQEIIDFVFDFGKQYGYNFEHEATYDEMCLVNDAVYIARKGDKWEAVGAQFQHPYVYKTLFSKEEIGFDDLCETKNVSKGSIYLDTSDEKPMALSKTMRFIGRIGRFVPVLKNGGTLYRVYEDKFYAVTRTKDHHWAEAEVAKEWYPDNIDWSYYENLVDKAKLALERYGAPKEFYS